jgi:hypothetical protein
MVNVTLDVLRVLVKQLKVIARAAYELPQHGTHPDAISVISGVFHVLEEGLAHIAHRSPVWASRDTSNACWLDAAARRCTCS